MLALAHKGRRAASQSQCAEISDQRAALRNPEWRSSSTSQLNAPRAKLAHTDPDLPSSQKHILSKFNLNIVAYTKIIVVQAKAQEKLLIAKNLPT